LIVSLRRLAGCISNGNFPCFGFLCFRFNATTTYVPFLFPAFCAPDSRFLALVSPFSPQRRDEKRSYEDFLHFSPGSLSHIQIAFSSDGLQSSSILSRVDGCFPLELSMKYCYLPTSQGSLIPLHQSLPEFDEASRLPPQPRLWRATLALHPRKQLLETSSPRVSLRSLL